MRRRVLALPVLMLAGLASAQAASGDLAVPTLPTVTLTVPSLTVPTLTVPTLPIDPGSLLGGAETSAPSRSTESRKPAARGQASKGLELTNFRARPWRFKNDPRAGDEMGTRLIFRLSGAATVTFSVRQEAPSCRSWGDFHAAGIAGRNRVPWTGRLRGEQLPPGTYRISALARSGQKQSAVRRETVVIVPLRESTEDARAAPSRCESGASGRSSGGLATLARTESGQPPPSSGASGISAGDGDGAALEPGDGERQAAPFTGPPLPPLAGGGDRLRPGAALATPPGWLVPFLFAALGLALLLLALAAAPARLLGKDGAALVDAHRRTNLALAAASMLAGLTAAWFLL